jgi:hypothetical protein
MTIGGWISMTISIGFTTGLFGWCCYKMLVAPAPPKNSAECGDDEPNNVEQKSKVQKDR